MNVKNQGEDIMKISLIQMESNGNKNENEEKAFKFLNKAIQDNPDIICLSELFLSWGKDFNSGIVCIDDIEVYKDFAKNNNVNLILGSVALKSKNQDKTTNTCFVIDRNGNIVGKYDKKYMYVVNRQDYKLDEREDTIPGEKLGIVELDNIKIGIGICFDLRFPEYFRDLTKNGAKIIFLPAHFVEKTGSIAWNILTKARAIENQIYFCACNQTGNGVCGNSKVIDYEGNIVKELEKEEDVLMVELDIDKQEKYRRELPVLEQM